MPGPDLLGPAAQSEGVRSPIKRQTRISSPRECRPPPIKQDPALRKKTFPRGVSPLAKAGDFDDMVLRMYERM